MYLAPIATGLYPVFYSLAVKLLIDLFLIEGHITFYKGIVPITWFVGNQIFLDVAWRIHNLAQMKSIPYVFEDLMIKVCTHCFNLPYTYFQDTLSGSIISKVKGIGDKFFKIHQNFEWKLSTPIFITLFSGIALAKTNAKIFLFIVGFTLIYSPLAFYFFYKLSKIEGQKQDAWYHLFGTVSDRINNIMTIFSFAKRQDELQKITTYYKKNLNPISVYYFKYDFWISVALGFMYWFFVIGLFLFVVNLRNQGEISIGEIAFVMALTFEFTENTWKTTLNIKDFLEDLAAFKSAFTLMKQEQCTIDPINAKELIVSEGEIDIKELCFQYENGKPVFQNLNLTIKAGQKIGLVGHSGAGKSTLTALLLKNFKQTEGDIYIDNQNIKDITSDSVRANIALIPQDIMLFHRSIKENIAYAKEDATMEEIENAAKIANIHNFIMQQPDQYNTLVGERGIKLSGGQRQRIAIARAILKKAPILILDEATSSLDSETENDIQNAINQILDKNKTTVIAIAHRLSTIKHMDRIIVMEDGHIVEDGVFNDLLNISNGKFASLWNHQVNGMIV
ncbi:MAG: ABC transporter ATP-binding protein [Proteobacteria bacterium]|nr:ABC transporter ATP-binding protein [Pseudomonadota bacterium]